MLLFISYKENILKKRGHKNKMPKTQKSLRIEGRTRTENKTKEAANNLNSWCNMNEEGKSGVFKALTEKVDKCE